MTPTQKALLELRGGLSQEDFARKLGVARITVARWETSREPSGISLLRLETFALRYGHIQIAAVFRHAIEIDEESNRQQQGWLDMPNRTIYLSEEDNEQFARAAEEAKKIGWTMNQLISRLLAEWLQGIKKCRCGASLQPSAKFCSNCGAPNEQLRVDVDS